jgi:hypothetical protein
MMHPRPSALVLGALAVSGLAPSATAMQLKTYTDGATFRAETGAAGATGPLPDLGLVVSATVGSVTFSVAPGGDNLAIGASGTLAEPDWSDLLPGNDIALGYENLQVDFAAPMYSLGFDFAQPDVTMPIWGGTPVDSTFEISLYDGATLVGQTQFAAIPADVATFLGVWSKAAFTSATIVDVTVSPFVDDDEFFGEFYTGDVPAPVATVTACTDKAAFLAGTGATSASGPIPNLGSVSSAKLGSVTLGIGPGGDDLLIGAFATGAEPDWCPLLPGHDIAQGYENLEVVMDEPVTSFGIDFVQPDATMPPYGGTPIDSVFEMTLFSGGVPIGQVLFTSIPVDTVAFLGVCSDTPFDRVTLIDVTASPFVDDDEFYGEIYTGPGPAAWTNLGHGLAGVNGDPLLYGTGPLTDGSSGSLVLERAAPASVAVLVVALSGTEIPILCGTLVPWPPLLIATAPTSPSGGIAIGWSNWDATFSGASLFFQFGLLDPSAICGVSISNALRADVP